MHDGTGDGLRVNSGKNIQFYDNTIYKLGHDGLFAIGCQNVEAWNNRITCRTNSGLRNWNSNGVKFHDNVIDSFYHWQYFTNWIEKSFSFIPISKYFSVKCLKS